METGPPLQNRMWDVLVRNHLKLVAWSGDLMQAFAHVRIRFQWVKGKQRQRKFLSMVSSLKFCTSGTPTDQIWKGKAGPRNLINVTLRNNLVSNRAKQNC
jgi:hypothetical protein